MPSLAQQQKPYLEKKDSLIGVISEIIRNPDWMPTDPPYQAYSALIQSLREINLDDYNKDCGRDKSVDRGHSCNLCSLTAQQVYHQLDIPAAPCRKNYGRRSRKKGQSAI